MTSRNKSKYSKKEMTFVEEFLDDNGLIDYVFGEIGTDYKTLIDWNNDLITFIGHDKSLNIKISDILEAAKEMEGVMQ